MIACKRKLSKLRGKERIAKGSALAACLHANADHHEEGKKRDFFVRLWTHGMHACADRQNAGEKTDFPETRSVVS